MAARTKWWHMLQASRREALLAVDLYNRTAAERSLEGFVVHMHLAWLYLLHARFTRDGIDYRYRQPNGRFVRVDGEVKTWELGRCVRQAWADPDNAVRCNIDFFIKIRNKIEHRYEELLAAVIAGKSQALVLNFEEILVSWFGADTGLGDSLRFPVFMSSLTPDAVTALKETHRKLPKKVVEFIREHDASLPEEVQSDWRYDFRVLLVPQTGRKTEADAVMRFVREEEMTDKQRKARDVVQTIVRNKPVSVQNKGKHKPGVVARAVQNALGVAFPIPHHTRAWQHYKVRPPTGAARPELTDDRYCVWDEPHGDLPLHRRMGHEARARPRRPARLRADHWPSPRAAVSGGLSALRRRSLASVCSARGAGSRSRRSAFNSRAGRALDPTPDASLRRRGRARFQARLSHISAATRKGSFPGD